MGGQREEYKREERGTQWSAESDNSWRQDFTLQSDDLVEIKGLSSA